MRSGDTAGGVHALLNRIVSRVTGSWGYDEDGNPLPPQIGDDGMPLAQWTGGDP